MLKYSLILWGFTVSWNIMTKAQIWLDITHICNRHYLSVTVVGTLFVRRIIADLLSWRYLIWLRLMQLEMVLKIVA